MNRWTQASVYNTFLVSKIDNIISKSSLDRKAVTSPRTDVSMIVTMDHHTLITHTMPEKRGSSSTVWGIVNFLSILSFSNMTRLEACNALTRTLRTKESDFFFFMLWFYILSDTCSGEGGIIQSFFELNQLTNAVRKWFVPSLRDS